MFLGEKIPDFHLLFKESRTPKMDYNLSKNTSIPEALLASGLYCLFHLPCKCDDHKLQCGPSADVSLPVIWTFSVSVMNWHFWEIIPEPKEGFHKQKLKMSYLLFFSWHLISFTYSCTS